jgi:hypothetical protein
MLSTFTPTHNPQFIHRLEASLLKQSIQNFEWIVVPNGEINISDLCFKIPNVRIVKEVIVK